MQVNFQKAGIGPLQACYNFWGPKGFIVTLGIPVYHAHLWCHIVTTIVTMKPLEGSEVLLFCLNSKMAKDCSGCSLLSTLTSPGHESVNSLERFTELAALRSPYSSHSQCLVKKRSMGAGQTSNLGFRKHHFWFIYFKFWLGETMMILGSKNTRQ